MSTNTRPTVVGLCGSIRTRESEFGVDETVGSESVVDAIQRLDDRSIYDDDYLDEIQPFVQDLAGGDEKKISNSETLTLTALYGAKRNADIEYHKLTDYVGVNKSYADIDEDRIEPLIDVVDGADGIVIGTPVYFGDRSSLMHSFIRFCSDRGLLEGKVVGTVSVGSKRNGGQETANVYALFENLNHGAYVVGNGPKTCQYGGTGWGGDIGDVTDDEFGLETSMGTGIRVSQVAELVNRADAVDPATHEGSFDVGVLIVKDKDGIVRSAVREDIAALADTYPAIDFNYIDVTEEYIQACIACDVCPTPRKVDDITGDGQDYKCIIDEDIDETRFGDDTLENVHEWLMDQDALIVASMDIDDEQGAHDMYQTLLERTRYIRRDDWRLHNTPLCAYLVRDAERNSIIPMKVMSAWMRHNTVICPPIDRPRYPVDAGELEEMTDERVRGDLDGFLDAAVRLNIARRRADSAVLSYKATGYDTDILDPTVAERS